MWEENKRPNQYAVLMYYKCRRNR